MGQGQKISSEMQQAIVRLSRMLNNEQIAMCLDLSTCSVRRVLSHFHTYGTTSDTKEPPGEDECKGNRHLRDVDVEFLLGTIQKMPDLYLDELQEMLATSCGVQVSCSTVWHTLRRSGFTMKKVGNYDV
ncbi:hypothetical protein PISMIDRAFT_112404 [Pisolithus microcarpus 441]|uniref:Winged helix-turn helix domain-containing protein n=1 Tax=Pisolithus microcarpus 441 TaxID=765257 RepID=A0A0C9ZAF1_9AGAM|nr:hypothetical protein PISMIDRAFT_112404 [Pisolithus microcarpus 441]